MKEKQAKGAKPAHQSILGSRFNSARWDSTRLGSTRLDPSAGAGLAAAGTIVRIVAATDAFWMDEIWSLLLMANKADSAWQIFSGMPESNNHHLVTLWMYLCGYQPGGSWFVYRVPSLLAGTGTILLSAQIARRWGNWAAVVAALLAATSYMQIVYTSEGAATRCPAFSPWRPCWVRTVF